MVAKDREGRVLRGHSSATRTLDERTLNAWRPALPVARRSAPEIPEASAAALGWFCTYCGERFTVAASWAEHVIAEEEVQKLLRYREKRLAEKQRQLERRRTANAGDGA